MKGNGPSIAELAGHVTAGADATQAARDAEEVGARAAAGVFARDAHEIEAWDGYAAAAIAAHSALESRDPSLVAELAARTADALLIQRRARAPRGV